MYALSMTVTASTEDLLISRPDVAHRVFVFAHGAGAPMDNPWMDEVTQRLVDQGFCVVRFEFPYMKQRRETGKKKPPDRAPKLLETWRSVIPQVRGLEPDVPIFIGGKSMGGRIASLVADDCVVAGLICLGFPFHAPGRELGDRVAHLETIKTPMLILQGERDAMGSKPDLDGFRFSKTVTVRWLPDGDHSLKPRKKSGYTLSDNLDTAAEHIDQFTKKLG